MEIIRAESSDLKTVLRIVRTTIKNIYPHYYPKGAVDYFLAHHTPEKIIVDIADEKVSIAVHEGKAVGTVSVSNDEIYRLFVLPEHQRKGYGSELLSHAESRVAERFGTARLDVSLPAKRLYARKGYIVISTNDIETENGDHLCYDVMLKRVN